MKHRAQILVIRGLLLGALFGSGYGQPVTSNSLASRVAEVFAANCFSCHNRIDRKGGLSLQTYEALMRGGDRGPELTPDVPEESRLLLLVEGFEEPMMPKGGTLLDEEIDLIREWIEAGALPWVGDLSEINLRRVPEIRVKAPVQADITSLRFSPDGKWLAVGEYRTVRLIDSGSREVVRELKEPVEAVQALAFSPDGKWLIAAGGQPARYGEIHVWDLESGESGVRLQGHSDAIYTVSFHPTKPVFSTGSYDKQVFVWSLASREKLFGIQGHVAAVYETAFSVDGRWLLSASADRTIKIWSSSSGQQLFKPISESSARLLTMAVHPNGREVSAAGADKMIRTWRLSGQGGTLLRSTFAHNGAVLDLAYTPDGETLVSSGEDLLVKFWNSDTLEELDSLDQQSDWVSVLDISPDGRTLVLGRYDGTVSFVPIPPGPDRKEHQIAR